MASLDAKTEVVKAAVASTSSCTPATVVTLKELLLPVSEPKKTSRAAKGAAGAKPQTAELLGTREKTVLATHVINATLKALAEAAKPPPPSTPSKRHESLRQAAGKRKLRRSASAPLSPLQPRTLNRVATSPSVVAKDAKPVPPPQSMRCLATVESARVAFACLRSVKGPLQDGQADLQLENGMAALVGKLLALGLHDQALKELRILKRRLDGPVAATAGRTGKAAPAPADSGPAAAGIADLLEFRGSISKQTLPTITACQTQVLKLVAATKKPAHIEALLPAVQDSNPLSPINLLLRLAEGGDKEASKAARQMASLSKTLLSLSPSVSTSEDAVATEPRLSPSPAVAFELQVLAFRTQLKWWKLAGHQGSVDDEILPPFACCARAFVRRQTSDDRPVYRAFVTAFEGLMQIVRSQKHQPATSSKAPLSSIYQLLGSTAHAARQYDDAYRWLQSLRGFLCPESESFVRVCSVSARMLAAALKRSDMGSDIEQLLGNVTAALDGSLSGTVAELDELLESLSAARRSAVGLLTAILDPNAAAEPAVQVLGGPLKAFILRFPRFVRRWMGTPPSKEAGAKLVLQFDQRRQMVTRTVNQVLDGALMVLKCDIQVGSSQWQLMDDVLQHCAALLEPVADAALSTARTEQLGAYHVKISNLYFSQFLALRRAPGRSKDESKQLLQALSRSIDAVKERPPADQEKAQLSTKLELFADLCKGAGRTDDALRTLRSICTNMAEDGVLSAVAAALATQPPAVAWATTDKASSLSRTLHSIARLDRSWNDWTFFLPEAERAAVLEHLMHLSSDSASFELLRLHDPSLTALLRIYTLDKYPIRRLRVLLHLFYQNIGEGDEVDEVATHVDQALQQLHKDTAEDAALSHYMPHLRAYHGLIVALADSGSGLAVAAVGESISAWRAMAQPCQTREALYAVIDNPDDLLDHLQSLSRLAGLRGENQLQLSVSELSITLAASVADGGASAHDSLILNHSQLAAQYITIGRYTQALEALEQTKSLIERHEGVSRRVVADFYLSQIEYYSGIGSFDEAARCLSKANDICSQSHSSWAQSKAQATVMLATASLLRSTVSLQRGDVQDALVAVKSSVRALSHDWSRLEAASTSGARSAETSTWETSTASIDVKPCQARTSGPRFWGLASPLLRSLLHMSCVYAHIGMFQETVYYAEFAARVAESTNSSLYRAQVSAWSGSVYAKAGILDKALAVFDEADQLMPRDACSARARFARQVGEFYGEMGDAHKARKYLKMAEDTIHRLGGGEAALAESKTGTGAAKTRKGAATGRTARATRTTKTDKARLAAAAAAAPRTAKRGPTMRIKAAVAPDLSRLPRDVHQSSLLAAVMLARSVGLIRQKDWSSALSTLEQAKELPKMLGTLSQEQVATATSLIGQSMEQMISDPVFSVMQDSTISFPAVCGSPDKAALDRLSSTSLSPPSKGRGDRKRSRERGVPAFAEALRQAQELLLEAHGAGLSQCDSSTVHRISTLLQSTVVLLSAASSASKARATAVPGLATVAVDVGRNVAWAREQKTLKAPEPAARRCSVDAATDLARFHKTYVETIPKSWSVISMSLGDNGHDLCISKLQAEHSPFILRLPLGRANSRDANSDVFSFEHGREELLDIVRLANETSHSARDFAAKGERSAWWAERKALDARLRDLLEAMEATWLGGFRGIFSQHAQRPELLACFQKSFQQMLNSSLPSRSSQMRSRRTASRAPGSEAGFGAGSVTLDPRILDLFIGLGDPAGAGSDYNEALSDLLYFVVDVLQFQGERNAYDEIDFDTMVVETYDALRGYYGARPAAREDGAHTVLVLDKALHAFPWESLPCMEGMAVTRVPSLACLRRLLAEAAPARRSGRPPGHYVTGRSGTYVLNPSSDLGGTQACFEPALGTLPTWRGIVGRAPGEAEFAGALSSELLLYFGHGSGAQYVRGRTVRRLDKCRAAALLMGCSSAALTAAGEFECYGPVWNYLMAGSPAVVGTLWDVTDRDIDRLAGRVFEEWGLLARGTFGDGTRGPGDEPTSLAEAVARAREACRFKFLNAAAVVVYGIPVYIEDDDESNG